MRRRPLLLLLAAAAWLLPAGPAAAHPFGEPQAVSISATPAGLRLAWSASADDLEVLAGWIGAAPGSGSLTVWEDGALVESESTELPGVQLAHAPQLADYLLERITVTAGGTPCAGTMLPVADVEAAGVTLDFDCGSPVASADVGIATLTDVDPAYRTLATGPFGQRRAYGSDTGAVTWTLSDAGPTATDAPAAAVPDDRGRSALLQLGGVGLGAAALVAGGVALVRRRRSRPL